MTTCPDTCEDAEVCMLCYELTCPVHGVPDLQLGELAPEDTKTFCINQGAVHRICHEQYCHSSRCAAEAA